MRSWRTPAAGLFALLALLGSSSSDAAAADGLLARAVRQLRTRLSVTEFHIGYLEPNTDRFVPTGGASSEEVHRDAVLMLVFSEPISLAREVRWNPTSPFVHLQDRSIRIGIPSESGLLSHANGAFYQYVEKEFDPQQGFVPKRAYRDRVLFDPTRRFDDPSVRTPQGFEAGSTYSVTVPRAEYGAYKTVRTPDGARIGRTFTATFRTGFRYRQDFYQPRLDGVEADDAPGVPLAGREDVDPSAAIVARFSEAMTPESFVLEESIRIRDAGTGAEIPGTVTFSADLRVFSYRADPDFGAGPREMEVILTGELRDFAGNPLFAPATVRFFTRPGPATPE